MAKKSEAKKSEVESEVEETSEATPDVEADESDEGEIDNSSDVDVEYINETVGLTTRNFSRDVHGKDFKKLATQFAEKHNGTIVE